MRIVGTLALSLAAGLLLVGLVAGQRPGGFPAGGMGGPPTDSGSLVHNQKVQKELKLTEEQVKKMDEGIAKVIGGVLDADQMKRLNQIQLQLHGAMAFTDPKVQTALKLTTEQKDSIKTILSDNEKEIKDLLKEAKGKEVFMKVRMLKKEASEKVTNMLTDVQKKDWREMVGAEFKLGMAGGMKGKGKDKKPGD